MNRSSFVLLLLCVGLKGVLVACTTFCVGNQTSCQKECCNNTCHELQWYVNNSSEIKSNSTLLFLPGQHKLLYNTTLNISNVSNFVMKGKAGNVIPSIFCSKNIGGITFSGVQNVNITDIKIKYCGTDVQYKENFTIHAAVSFLSCFNITISNIVVSNSTGCGLHVDRVYGFIRVLRSKFEYSKSSKEHRFSANARFFYGNNSLEPSKLSIIDSCFQNGYSRIPKHEIYKDAYDYKSYELEGSGLVLLIYAPSIQVTIINVTVKNNTAKIGANIAFKIKYFHENTSTISISNSKILEGIGSKGAGLMGSMQYHNNHKYDSSFLYHTKNNTHNLVSIENVTFSNNNGGAVKIHLRQLQYIDSTVQTIFFKNCNFINNTGYRGVAVTIIKILFAQLLPNNAAIIQFNVIFRNCSFVDNTAKTSESNTSTEESVMMLLQAESVVVTDCKFINNKLTGISLINSYLHFTGFVYFENNSALYGGALGVWDSSIIYMTPPTRVHFINNYAKKMGGAIFIDQRRLDSDPPCFYQPTRNHGSWNESDIANMFQFQYFNNKAHIAGDALYGGALNYCFMITKWKENPNRLFHIIHNFTNQTGPSIVASDPIKILFCNLSTHMPIKSAQQLNISVHPGETFSLNVSAVGELNGAVPAPIFVRSKNTLDKVIQNRLSSKNHSLLYCYSIKVAVYTNSSHSILEIVIDTFSATDIAITSRFTNKTEVNVFFKECPWIFQQTKNFGCDCNPLIKNLDHNVKCDINTKTFNRGQKGVWIGCTYSGTNSTETNTTTPCSFIQVTANCPSEYCAADNLIFNSSNISMQCQDGREGVLCGKCKENFSLSLGQELCISNSKCSIWMLVTLILVFVFAGISLVFFLSLLNFTVTQGTMYGVLCYVSMVHANHNLLLSSGPRPLSIVIAWLNLDFGFNVCLYSGLNAYQKIWLEFSFIFYLLFLSLTIIFLSHRFIFFTRLVGRNVVSVISTIMVLSYSKIVRISIKALRYVVLHTSDDKTLMVWYSDGNIVYFSGKHLPLAIVALIMLVMISLYLMALLFIQCLQRRSNWFVLRWADKLRPFFDANTGPCRDYYRFWPGFLLSCILAIFVMQVGTLKSKNQLNVSLAFCVCIFILACISPHGVYKKWPLNVLEFSFFLNLGFVTTLFSILKQEKIKENLAAASVGIALLTFTLIILLHCYQKISSTKKFQKLAGQVKGKKFQSNFFLNVNTTAEEYGETAQTEIERRPLLTTPTFRYDNQLRETLLSNNY